MMKVFERLIIISFFAGFAVWLAYSVRRSIKTGAIWGAWGGGVIFREKGPINFWSSVAVRVVSVVSAAIMAATYFYLSATNSKLS
jgi:hypothetical protein